MAHWLAALVGSLTLWPATLAQAQAVIVAPPAEAVTGGVTFGFSQTLPRDNQQTKPGTATLRGRVFGADTGQPLRKAQVRITSGELRENRLTTTDVSGRYEFRELPAGRYNLNASKGSYVCLAYGQLRPNEPGKPLEILEWSDHRQSRFRAAAWQSDHGPHSRRVRRFDR